LLGLHLLRRSVSTDKPENPDDSANYRPGFLFYVLQRSMKKAARRDWRPAAFLKLVVAGAHRWLKPWKVKNLQIVGMTEHQKHLAH
jgi:hypothetical protein